MLDKLKEAFQTWLAKETPETADTYWQARRAAAYVAAEAKTQKFKGTIEKDFQLASKRFWQADSNKVIWIYCWAVSVDTPL